MNIDTSEIIHEYTSDIRPWNFFDNLATFNTPLTDESIFSHHFKQA